MLNILNILYVIKLNMIKMRKYKNVLFPFPCKLKIKKFATVEVMQSRKSCCKKVIWRKHVHRILHPACLFIKQVTVITKRSVLCNKWTFPNYEHIHNNQWNKMITWLFGFLNTKYRCRVSHTMKIHIVDESIILLRTRFIKSIS